MGGGYTVGFSEPVWISLVWLSPCASIFCKGDDFIIPLCTIHIIFVQLSVYMSISLLL